jgi:hypothetical protein
MIMADVLKWVLVIGGLLVVFVCFWLAVVALFPTLVDRTQIKYDRPFKLLGVGLPAAAFFIILAVLLFKLKNPVFQLTGSVVIGTVVALGLVGSAGLAQRVGQGLPSPLDAAQPWRRVYRGGTVLSLVFLLPFVGWFLILPMTLLTGFGAALMSFSKKGALPAQPAKMEEPSISEGATAA